MGDIPRVIHRIPQVELDLIEALRKPPELLTAAVTPLIYRTPQPRIVASGWRFPLALALVTAARGLIALAKRLDTHG